MIVANLRRRPVRSLISIVAVAMEVVLILMIVGLVNGMINDHRARVSGIGADVIIRAGNGSMFAELSGNTLPVKLAPVFAAVPGVEAVAPVAYAVINGTEAIGGIDPASFRAVSGGFHFLAGSMFQPGGHEVIVDDAKADGGHLHVGGELMLFGQPFRITGIFEHGMGSRVFLDLPVLEQLSAAPGKVATFYVKTAPGVPQDRVVAALQKLAPAETVQPISQYLSLFTAAGVSPALPIFQAVMVAVAVAIGFLVIFLSLYTTVLERTREIGILKSLGASRGYIVKIILRESELLAVLGVAAGSLVAWGLWHLLSHLFPTLPIEFTWEWIGFAAAIALASSAVGALYPAFKAAGQDAISALAYE